MSRVARLEADLTDLRDKADKLQAKRALKPKDKRKRLNRAIEEIRAKIDRVKIRLRKAKRKRWLTKGPNVVHERISPNRSSRGGVRPSIIVLHCTQSNNVEGSAEDVAGMLAYFANPNSQVSSHVVVDSDGFSGRSVADEDKAWTQAAFNAPALSIENIGFANQTSWTEAQEDECARWIAQWCRKFDIPCQRAAVNGANVTRPGIITHAELGAAGGNHTDPGANFRVDLVLRRAEGFLKAL